MNQNSFSDMTDRGREQRWHLLVAFFSEKSTANATFLIFFFLLKYPFFKELCPTSPKFFSSVMSSVPFISSNFASNIKPVYVN